MKDIPMQTEQEDFFIKVWPDEPISAGPEPVTTDGAVISFIRILKLSLP